MAMANGKVIAVSGPPGCGKTTLSIKLAQEIHDITKKKVVYVSTDTTIPAMGLIFPRREKSSLGSLGAALVNANLARTDFLSVLATTDAMPNMGYLGYLPGENRYSYPELSEKKVQEMLRVLRENFDYIVVDCDRNNEETISKNTCPLCDYLIQMINPDIKTIAYYGSDAILDDAIQVLNLLDKDVYLPIQDIKAHFPNVQHTIMYSRAAKMQMVEGELMDRLKDKVYLKGLHPLAKQIVDFAKAAAEPEEQPAEMPPEAQPLEDPQTDDFWK